MQGHRYSQLHVSPFIIHTKVEHHTSILALEAATKIHQIHGWSKTKYYVQTKHSFGKLYHVSTTIAQMLPSSIILV
jgi:hypothetical protein